MEDKPFVSSSSSSSQQKMISPSSSFKPKLNDQDFMELVCENGKILAKSRKPGFFKNQRTQSLLDLYEIEYDENFMKNIKNLEDTQVVPVSNDEHTKKKFKSSKIESKSSKNVEVITTHLPDEQSIAIGRSKDLYFASSRGTSRDLSCSLRKKHGDIEEEESTYLSNSSDDESDDAKTRRTRKTTKKRKRSIEVHKLSERKRRNEINKRMRDLQDLLPNYYKDDKVSLLDEAIKYMRTLQLQVQMMSIGNGFVQPSMMMPMGHYSPMSLGMHMGAPAPSIPQFQPMIVQGTGFPGINEATLQMLSFMNHSTGLTPNSPMESFSPQFVVPSCVPQAQGQSQTQAQTQTQATSFTQFPKSASTSNLENAMQFRGSNGYYH